MDTPDSNLPNTPKDGVVIKLENNSLQVPSSDPSPPQSIVPHQDLVKNVETSNGIGQTCSKCTEPMTGQFVRALNGTYHLSCFRCLDCDQSVAAKFFPVVGQDGKQYPICEKDYYRRLNLVCEACGGILYGSYITALDKRYHVEHFTCSVCPTVFGPQDSYYENEGKVYCHYHYSVLFAVRCCGCQTAILKQFVELNRNGFNEHWHPECYMIHKFWNVKLASSNTITDDEHDEAFDSKSHTTEQLKYDQRRMEDKVYQIWTILSAFEESSAACISDMLLHVSNGEYLEGVKMAENFINHVEILFSAVDDLEEQLARYDDHTEMEHSKEPKLLCKKIVSFFSLLSHTQESGVRRMGITQELLTLVAGLAHYLKVLIRIALTAALKLENRYGSATAIYAFLNKLVEFGENDTATRRPYIRVSEITSDLCFGCRTTIEGECIQYETYRWHTECFKCNRCSIPLHQRFYEATFDEKHSLIYCPNCSKKSARAHGFRYVTQLEQYAFLLRVALKRLYTLLNVNENALNASSTVSDRRLNQSDTSDDQDEPSSPKNDDNETVKQIPSRKVDRKLTESMTHARRQTVVEHHQHTSSIHSLVNLFIDKDNEIKVVQSPKLEQNIAGEYPVLTEPHIKCGTVIDRPLPGVHTKPLVSHPPPSVGDRKRYLSELSELETFIVKHLAVVNLSPLLEKYISFDELLSLVDTRKVTIWDRFKTGLKTNKKQGKVKVDGTFGLSLDQMVEKHGIDSDLGVIPGRIRIPVFIEKSIRALSEMDMTVEGIFRKNGNIRRLRELTEAIDKGPSDVDLTKDNAIQIAALLKKYLRELPDPLLTFKLQKVFVSAQKLPNEQDRRKVIHLACCLMPKPHRDTMEALFIFLRWVSNFSHVGEDAGSKMDLANLATVVAPNILYTNSKDPVKDESFLSIETVYALLKYQDEMWQIPPNVADILQEQGLIEGSSGLSSKDLLKRCENYVKLRKPSLHSLALDRAFSNSSGPATPTS
ncbi:Rho-type GTPase activating protein Rga1 [Basidiobolus ranarum]|uniref:Rho-type GTPase activating protein Rga1 n=1 Tax=Basidiobolus ranarum TaxID=34480 RepID=A0ABR2X3U2_9FUNG